MLSRQGSAYASSSVSGAGGDDTAVLLELAAEGALLKGERATVCAPGDSGEVVIFCALGSVCGFLVVSLVDCELGEKSVRVVEVVVVAVGVVAAVCVEVVVGARARRFAAQLLVGL